MRKHLLILLLFLLTACAGQGNDAPAGALPPTPALLPTPTLLPALAVQQPETAVSPPAADLLATGDPTGLKQATAKPTATPTPTPSPTPTQTPRPAARVALGETHLHNEDYAAAIAELGAALRQRAQLSDRQISTALANLGLAYLRSGQPAAAERAFAELLGLSDGLVPDAVYFHLGRAQQQQGSLQAAIGAYEAYLARNPDMATYVKPFIAEAHFALGDRAAGIAAYEAALAGSGYRLAQISLRRQLADFYLSDGDYAAAIAQYDAIHDLAQTEATRGEMTYLAGTAALLAGDAEAAYARYLSGMDAYPRAYESYLGLVALVEAGIPVDEYQRGLVDYYAGAYFPAIDAFERYLAANPTNYRADTHLYLAWSYEGAGSGAAALPQLAAYAAFEPAAAAIERAKLLARVGDGPAARAGYLAYLEAFPRGDDAPFAAWWAAQWSEWLGDTAAAVTLYQRLAEAYPAHADAPEALFRAGLLAEESGEWETAVRIWLALSERYPDSSYSAATLVWLLRALPAADAPAIEATPDATPSPTQPASTVTPRPTATATVTATPGAVATAPVVTETAPITPTAGVTPTLPVTGTLSVTNTLPITPTGILTPTAELTPIITPTQPLTDTAWLLAQVRQRALRSSGSGYYALRARELVQGGAPFAGSGLTRLPAVAAAEQAEADAWLRDWLGLAPETAVRGLSPALAADPRLITGAKLWELDLREEAKRELESLRQDYATDALASYQLAHFFRDLGLYRSSIVAAEAVLLLSGQSVFDVPPHLARLAYPTYYADLILPLAAEYGYDPLLQFSLVRQESLFESFARSGAAAQGLSQVIPDTGVYIAAQLAWPDFVNEDLYRPVVGLAFGAFYLAQQLDTFDGFVAAALSAYNAGPGNALRWVNAAGADHDLYVETVNFAETRLYIERIYVGHAIYRYLYASEIE
ncbi:MAG: transglycosylase SLT domain-containing protein [Anaerolineales bacterium]|nr:transglycosylase SLT domain-containing protein [Anaerolineales bacterium]